MGAVVLDGGAEVAADGAFGGLVGVGGAHQVAPFFNGIFRFENDNDNLAGTHEVGQFAIERPVAVDGIEPFGLGLGQPQGLDGNDGEPSLVDALQDFALQIPAHCVRLDYYKRAFDCH